MNSTAFKKPLIAGAFTSLLALALVQSRTYAPEKLSLTEVPPTSLNESKCDDLLPGQICTFVGNPAIGNGVDPLLNRHDLRIGAVAHTPDKNGFFIADQSHHVIWYWNRSAENVVRLGSKIEARTIRIIAGSGTSSGQELETSALRAQLSGVSHLLYDEAHDRLFFTEPTHNRIRFINTEGVVKLLMDSKHQTAHRCLQPRALATNDGVIYAACSGNQVLLTWESSSLEPLETIPAPGIIHLATDRHRIYGLQAETNKIFQIKARQWKTIASLPLSLGHIKAMAARKQMIFMATAKHRLVSLDAFNQELRDHGPLAASDLSVTHSSDKFLAFSSPQSGTFGLYDPGQKWVVQRIGTGKFLHGFTGDHDLLRHEQRLRFVTGLAFDRDNSELLVVDAGNCRIRRIGRNGLMNTAVSRGCGSPMTQNNEPLNAFLDFLGTEASLGFNGLSLLKDNSVLIANTGAKSLALWNRSKTQSSFFGKTIGADRITTLAGDPIDHSGPLKHPTHAILDPTTQEIIIVDPDNHCLRRLDRNGIVHTWLGKCGQRGTALGASSNPYLSQPTSIAFDSINNVIIADRGAEAILYYNRAEKSVTIGEVQINPGETARIACRAGGSKQENILAMESQCSAPVSVAIYKNRLCFTNQTAHNVRCMQIDGPASGKIYTVAGQPQAFARGASPLGREQEGILGTKATLNYPSALTFDDQGNLFIADTYNHIVRKLKMAQ